VVNLHGHKTLSASAAGDGPRQVNGMGTGVLIDPRGYILTNYHVVEGVSPLQVTSAEGRTVVARVIAQDPSADLAVIKIAPDDQLNVIRFGSSHDLMVGEPVIAMGNAYGDNHSVSRGVISALHRDVPVNETQQYLDLIQTDASINPGNSGGPLMNIDGEMIGLNVAVRVGAQGIGFAIPVNQALDVAARLIRRHNETTHWHGVEGRTLIVDGRPVFRVESVEEESPAAAAGVKAGDVVTAVGGKAVHRAVDFELAMVDREVGEPLQISLVHDQQARASTMLTAATPERRLSRVNEQAWSIAGLRLAPISEDEFQRITSRYRGGLRVTAVRPGSPAQKQNIQPGDVLVGMHVWETRTLENVGYVLTQAEFDRHRPVKCYILRDDRTHYTYLPVADSVRR
ncbi:MAG: trypsin-like peptidase domain-containing protein, partial [Planctomycetales bacterium]|nr:trypsin-like peptidase domain-containing protein [Planctomycetales bacterium]